MAEPVDVDLSASVEETIGNGGVQALSFDPQQLWVDASPGSFVIFRDNR
jgi:hypothetical protein